MILSVNDDGSISKRKLRDVLKNHRKSHQVTPDKSNAKLNIPCKPNPKFSQFEKEFKQFNTFEEQLPPKEHFECNKVEVPEPFKHNKPIQQASIQNQVNTVRVPKIFTTTNSQSNPQQVPYWRTETQSLKVQQIKWPPKPVTKAPVPKDPTRFYF